jgi:hypothetical protein
MTFQGQALNRWNPNTIENGGGLAKMKPKIIFLTLAVLLCLTVQIYALSNIAKGQCGTNPLGDTSGDTDFYVSKNQNTPASGMSSAASSSGKAAVALGSTVVNNATIQSLNPDKPSPQGPGVAIVWKVEAANPNNEKMLYDYLLNGPATGNNFLDKTGWIRESSWTWNTTEADAGENQIEVRVMRAGAGGFEDSMMQSFKVSAATQNNETAADTTVVDTTPIDTTVIASAPDTSSANDASNAAIKTASIDANPHPESKTGDALSANEDISDVTKTESVDANSRPSSKTADTKISKPRVAPDERPRQTPTTAGGLTPGPNMSMPDPSPKSSSSETETDATQSEALPDEPSTMEVAGKWTIKLENEGTTINPLTLIQTGESVMGMGTLNEQNTKLQVSAKGSVSNNAMSLEAWTIVSEYGNKIDKHIELELVKVDSVITGSYEMYSGEDLIDKGNATASRFAA